MRTRLTNLTRSIVRLIAEDKQINKIKSRGNQEIFKLQILINF